MYKTVTKKKMRRKKQNKKNHLLLFFILPLRDLETSVGGIVKITHEQKSYRHTHGWWH